MSVTQADVKFADIATKLEKQIKEKYGKQLGKQLIAGAKQEVDYSFASTKSTEWLVKYCRELENRL